MHKIDQSAQRGCASFLWGDCKDISVPYPIVLPHPACPATIQEQAQMAAACGTSSIKIITTILSSQSTNQPVYYHIPKINQQALCLWIPSNYCTYVCTIVSIPKGSLTMPSISGRLSHTQRGGMACYRHTAFGLLPAYNILLYLFLQAEQESRFTRPCPQCNPLRLRLPYGRC